jgi:hypothetical protein
MSMFFPPVIDLSMIGVFDAGVPNKERIYLRPTDVIKLTGFGLFLARLDPETGTVRPIHNFCFWFDDREVEPPSWICIYTGKGTPNQTTTKDGQPHYTYFWGNSSTLFGNPSMTAVLFKPNAISIGRRGNQPRKQLQG